MILVLIGFCLCSVSDIRYLLELDQFLTKPGYLCCGFLTWSSYSQKYDADNFASI